MLIYSLAQFVDENRIRKPFPLFRAMEYTLFLSICKFKFGKVMDLGIIWIS